MLNRVTITGADNSTDIDEMVELSAEFDFLEWGILVSRQQEESCRFPSRAWMKQLYRTSSVMNVSMHVCGRWVREFFTGKLDWDLLPVLQFGAGRFQFNTHAELHEWDAEAVAGSWIVEEEGAQVIVQYDNVNNALLGELRAAGVDAVPLFDLSHGGGVLPEVWPAALPGVYCGYAGGLGPENIAGQLPLIAAAAESARPVMDYWIDMEGRVRTADGASLDMDKVRTVLGEARRARAAQVAA